MMNLVELLNTGLGVMDEVPSAIGFQFSSGLPKNDYGSTFTVYRTEDMETHDRYVLRGKSKDIPKLEQIQPFLFNHVADVLVENGLDVQTQIISGLMVFMHNSKLTVLVTMRSWSPPTAQDIFNMVRIGN